MDRSSPVVLALMVLALVLPTAGCRDRTESAGAQPESSMPSPSVPSGGADEPGCDEAALGKASAQISTEWETWSPRSGIVLDHSLDAISAVWSHCPALPDGAKLMLDLVVDHFAVPSLSNLAIAQGRPLPASDLDLLEPKLPGHARFHDRDEAIQRAAWAWRDSVCEDMPAIGEAMSQVSGAERAAISWDRCLHRFDFITRDQYVATIRDTGTVGFALHDWLTRQAHVDEAIAAPLARAVVLGPHWSVRPSASLRLPTIATGTSIEDGAVLELRLDAAYRRDREVATLGATERVPSHPEPIIVALYDHLAEEVDQNTEMAERQGQTWAMPLLLVAHRDLPWSKLRPVLASALLAGFRRVELVGLGDDPANPLRTVTIHDATAGGPTLGLGAAATVQDLVDAVLARPGVPLRLLP